MEISYKNKWKPNSENKEFWEEVLTNRKIESVGFVNGRVDSLKLDSGETVYITPPQVIYIKEEVKNECVGDDYINMLNRQSPVDDLKQACDLLHSCLEWDNGGERDYYKIIEFLNRVDNEDE